MIVKRAMVFLLAMGPLLGGSTTLLAAVAGATRYSLAAESSFSRGCYPPCLCALLQASGGGGFDLSPAGTHDGFQEYSVGNVFMFFSVDPPVEITGSGTYRVASAPSSM